MKSNNILLIKRRADPYKGKWALPGGYVEWNESAEVAVAREVKEEVGLNAEQTKLIGVFSAPERHPQQVINIAYAVTVSGDPEAGDDAQECAWFSLSDLPVELAFDHKKIIGSFLVQREKRK